MRSARGWSVVLAVALGVGLMVGTGQGSNEIAPAPDERGVQTLLIAVLASHDPGGVLARWQPTADALTERVPGGYRFIVTPLDPPSLRQALATAAVDFVLADPGLYVELEVRHGVRRIATLLQHGATHATTKLGAVIFRRADRTDLKGLRDLIGQRLAMVDADSFAGWQIAWRELLEQGLDPQLGAMRLIASGTPEHVVRDVLAGHADAGTVRAGVLEQMAREGRIRLDDFALVHHNHTDGERFPGWVSTRLYPDWPFAVLDHVPNELAEQVAMALWRIPPDSAAGREFGWTVPCSYEIVHDTLRELRLAPYEHYGNVDGRTVLRMYWELILGVGLCLLLLTAGMIRFRRLNRRLSDVHASLKQELMERRWAEAELSKARDDLQAKNDELHRTNRALATSLDQVQRMQQQIIAQEKLAALGTLTAGIAHEIRNPLNFIVNFADLCCELTQELRAKLLSPASHLDKRSRGPVDELIADLQSNASRIHEHGRRADRIVRAMLEHARDTSGEMRPTNLNALVDQYVTLTFKGWRASDLSFSIDIERDFDPAVGLVAVAPQELSRVVLNLVNNACDALRDRWKVGAADGRPILWVSSRRVDDRVEIRLRDNGTGIPEARLEQVFQPFFTTKPAGSGTGLGLSISHDIVTRQHGGRLRVESVEGLFTEFIIELPERPALALEDAERGSRMQEERP